MPGIGKLDESRKWEAVLCDSPHGVAQGMGGVRFDFLFARQPVRRFCEIANKLV